MEHMECKLTQREQWLAKYSLLYAQDPNGQQNHYLMILVAKLISLLTPEQREAISLDVNGSAK